MAAPAAAYSKNAKGCIERHVLSFGCGTIPIQSFHFIELQEDYLSLTMK